MQNPFQNISLNQLIWCTKTLWLQEILLNPTIDNKDNLFSYKQLDLHFNKHHCQYEKNLPDFLKNLTLEEILLYSKEEKDDSLNKIRKNAEQIWNHNLFWNSINPCGYKPLNDQDQTEFQVVSDFFHKFQIPQAIKKLSIMGSGWLWCVYDDTVKVVSTYNSEIPNGFAIFNIDIWEHAYYVDFQNKRQNFVETLINNFMDYKFIYHQLKKINLV